MKLKNLLQVIKPIAMGINPYYGAGIAVVEGLFTKTKEKTTMVLNGKKSYIGLVITFAATIAQYLGYNVPLEASEGVTTSLAQIFQAVGVFITSIGLVHKADKAIK